MSISGRIGWRWSLCGRIAAELALMSVLVGLTGCGPTMETVRTTTNQGELATIALTAEDAAVCRMAARKLVDQRLLAEVATRARFFSVRKTAVERLTDRTALTKIAIQDRNDLVCQAAISRLTDQSALARVAMGAKLEYARLTAVQKLTSQALLAEIAIREPQDYCDLACRAAAERVTDQTALARVAVAAWLKDVRQTAVQKLTDQAVLAKVALKDKESDVRLCAVNRLIDQPTLAKVVRGDPYISVSLAALRRVTDKALFTQLALEFRKRRSRQMGLSALLSGDTDDLDMQTTYSNGEAALVLSQTGTGKNKKVGLAVVPNAKVTYEDGQLRYEGVAHGTLVVADSNGNTMQLRTGMTKDEIDALAKKHNVSITKRLETEWVIGVSIIVFDRDVFKSIKSD